MNARVCLRVSCIRVSWANLFLHSRKSRRYLWTNIRDDGLNWAFFSLFFTGESSFTEFISIVANNGISFKSLQRGPVLFLYARYACGRDKWVEEREKERERKERDEKRGNLGNYSYLCDVKECDGVLEGKLWEESRDCTFWISFHCTERKSIVFKKIQIFFLYVIQKIFFPTWIYR